MKQIYITALFVLCAICMSTQAQEYRHVLKDGNSWSYLYHHFEDNDPNKHRVEEVLYILDGTVEMAGQTYLAMYRREDFQDGKFYAGYREEGGKVYARRSAEESEYVVADFEYDGLYDIWGQYENGDNPYNSVKDVVDSIKVGTELYRRHTYLYNDKTVAIAVEGIGNNLHGITAYPDPFAPEADCYCDYEEFLYCYVNGRGFSAQDFYTPKYISLSEEERNLVASNNAFAFNLLRAMREQKDANIVVSPLSITFALGMLNNAASGQTQQEINETLGFDDADAVNNFCRRMLTESNKLDKETKSLIANTIFINEGQGYFLQQPFVEKVQSYYDATPEARNFRDGQTMDVINKWASDHTMGMIQQVLNDDSFNPEAVSYLLNATYFKGAWTNKFRKEFTSEEDFGKSGKKVPMMLQEDEFDYAEDENCQYIMLPYGNGAYSMTIYLPREDKALGDILSTLGGQNWQEWKKKKSKERVNLKLPRFETSIDASLNEIMQSLGIKQAFLETAEFPYFCNSPVYIGQMKQSAKIKVDEEGTEAAAVTVIDIEASGIPKTYYFHANRPFLYTISEQSTGVIFFLGQYLGEGGETPDGISSPSMVNGECSTLHDLQGRRLTTEPQKGVFIRDRKKEMK